MPLNNLTSILSYLKEDPLKNFNIIGFAENNQVTISNRYGNTVLIAAISDREWYYLHSGDDNELKIMLNELNDKAKCFGGLEDWMIPIIAERGEIDWVLPVYNYYLPPEIVIPENKIEITKLIPENDHFIIEQSNYKQFLSAEYVIQRINNSFSAAIHDKGKLVAWGLTHDDSSLGMLHVVDEYRHKGLGKEITISLVNQCREKGNLPVAQIQDDNIASVMLCTKLGFVKDRKVSWLKLK